MRRLFVYVISILLMIFPESVSLQGTYQQLNFPGKMVVTDNIIDAIKDEDVERLYDMLSDSQKEKCLSTEIEKMLDEFDDKIVDAEFYSNGLNSLKKDSTVVEEYMDWSIGFWTSKNFYELRVGWFIADTKNPQRVGLDFLILYDAKDNLLFEVS